MAWRNDGDGTIFEITPAGTLTTVLNLNGIDGAAPFSEGLAQGTDGNFTGPLR